MELKIKKIDKKVELDTKVEAFWNRCHVSYFSGYGSINSTNYVNWSCRLQVKRTARL